MKLFHVLILLSFSIRILNGSDSTSVVSGKVYDGHTSEPLGGATVIFGFDRGSSTDKNGLFTIRTKPGNITLTFQYIGYKSAVRSFTLPPDDSIFIEAGLYHEVTELEQIFISANKAEQRVSELTVSSSIIKPEMLSASHITSAQELLNKSSGIEVMDGQASVRGGSGFSYGAGSRVLALIDGLPVLSADAGNIKWQFLPLENLSQVEIIKGASSVLYGSSALNGIINFRTADAITDQPITKFFTETGFYDIPRREEWKWWDVPRTYSNLSLSHLNKFKYNNFSVTGTLLSNNGYRKLNDEKLGRLNVKLKHFGKNIEGLSYGMNLHGGYTEKRDFLLWEDANSGALKQNESTAILLHGSFIAADPYINLKRKDISSHDLKMRLQISNNKYPEHSQNDSKAISLYAEYQTWYKLYRFLNLNFGVSGYSGKIISPFYGDHRGINLAGYSQVDLNPIERIKLIAGVRLEYNSLDKIHDRLVPLFRTGINYKLLDYTFLRASFGQGYRYPSIAEKHASTTLGAVKIVPNPYIKPESGWNSEIGIKQGILTTKINGQADLALFYSENADMIEYIFGIYPDPVTGNFDFGFKSTNTEQSRVYGGELEFLLNYSTGNLQNTISGGYIYMYPVEFNPVTNRNTDTYLKYRRKHSGKLNLYSEYRRINFGISFFAKSKILNIDDVFINELTRENILPGFYDYWTNNNNGYLLMDINLGITFLKDKYTLSFVVKNLTNTEYMGRPGDIMPQRNFSIRFSGSL